jgi:hypothetical protein
VLAAVPRAPAVEDEDLGVIGQRPRHDRVRGRQGAEPAGEGHLVGRFEVLVGEDDDLVPEPQRP